MLHLETLELRKDVFFHQMERACMLQEHHGNNTMKDFSWTAMKARIISWDDVPGSIRRKCRWSGIIPRIGFCSARHSVPFLGPSLQMLRLDNIEKDAWQRIERNDADNSWVICRNGIFFWRGIYESWELQSVVFHLSSFHLCIHLEASVSLSVLGVRLVLVLLRFCVRLPGLLFYCWHQSIDRVRLALTDLAVNLFDVGANYN